MDPELIFLVNRGKIDLPPGIEKEWLQVLYTLIKEQYPQILQDGKPIFTFISGDEINHLEGMELLKTLEVVGHQDFGFFRGTSSQWEAAISFSHNDKKEIPATLSEPALAEPEMSNDIPDDHPALVGASAEVLKLTQEEIFQNLSTVPVQLPPRASSIRARQQTTIWSERLNEEVESDEVNSSSSSEFVFFFATNQNQKKKKKKKQNKQTSKTDSFSAINLFDFAFI